MPDKKNKQKSKYALKKAKKVVRTTEEIVVKKRGRNKKQEENAPIIVEKKLPSAIVTIKIGDFNVGIISRSGSVYNIIAPDGLDTIKMSARAISEALEGQGIAYKQFQETFWKNIPIEKVKKNI